MSGSEETWTVEFGRGRLLDVSGMPPAFLAGHLLLSFSDEDRFAIDTPLQQLRAKVRRIVVTAGGQRIKTLRGKRKSVRINLRRARAGRHVVRLRIRLSNGRVVRVKRTYRLCARPRQPRLSPEQVGTTQAAASQVMLLCRPSGAV